MYGKHFESMYEGSMYGAGLAVFAVWGYIIAHTRGSKIELNPKKLADTLGGTVNDIQEAVEFLERPDPQSRHKEYDGRRLVKEGEYQYFLPTWEDYQKIRNEEERRAYNRSKQREYRQRKKTPAQVRAENDSREKRSIEAMNNGDQTLADNIIAEDIPREL